MYIYIHVSYLIVNPSDEIEKSDLKTKVTSLLFVIIGCSNLAFPQ